MNERFGKGVTPKAVSCEAWCFEMVGHMTNKYEFVKRLYRAGLRRGGDHL